MFPVLSSLLSSADVPEVGMWVRPLQTEYRNILGDLTVVSFLPTLTS